MKTIIAIVAAVALSACGADSKKENTTTEAKFRSAEAEQVLAEGKVPNLVIARVKGNQGEKPTALENAEIVTLNAEKESLSDASQVADLYQQGSQINVAQSLEQDDSTENSSQTFCYSWYGGYNSLYWSPYSYGYGYGYGGYPYGYGYGYGGYPYYGYGAYSYPAYYGFYNPYYYGGYTYYTYGWW